MKKIGSFFLLATLVLLASCQNSETPKTKKANEFVQLIPQPNSIETGKDSLDISSGFRFNFSQLPPSVAENLQSYLKTVSLNIADEGKEIKLLLNTNQNTTPTDESYSLHIDKKGIGMSAKTEKGLFYAIQTYMQLVRQNPRKLPYVEIEDNPRFAYRGMHIDVSRHFFSLDFLKKQIDLMAQYKLNHFHWHLTDGPGWRIEIKKYPELTNIAAWRTHPLWKDWWASGRKYLPQGTPNAYGGYYTQEEARELVEYAAQRHITIVPEIEMPGHSEEVLAVYPHLACTGKPYTSSEFCIGNDETFVFLENVLQEIIDIFPSTFIHIGGDEASKEHWKNCPKCQARIQKEGLKNEAELQSYLIRRIEKFLHSKGRELIGWDEILEGGLDKSAVVMTWRDEKTGIEAAQNGHRVIMTPGKYLYFDSYQGTPDKQPEAIGGFLPIEQVYSYNPVPDSLAATHVDKIWGVQANMWAEYIPTEAHAEYMLYPRMLALAEVAWTNPENKSWESFKRRVNQDIPFLQKQGYNTYTLSKEPFVSLQNDSTQKAISIILTSEISPVEIRYTTDGTPVTSQSAIYNTPILVKDSAKLKTQLFHNGKPLGEVLERRIDYHKAIGKQIAYLNPYNRYYPAGGQKTLIDGLYGGFSHGDGFWQGFIGANFDVIIDLGKSETLRYARINFLQNGNAEIWLPKDVTISLSDEKGEKYETVAKFNNNEAINKPGTFFESFQWNGTHNARFIRITATINPAVRGWLFADEIIVW